MRPCVVRQGAAMRKCSPEDLERMAEMARGFGGAGAGAAAAAGGGGAAGAGDAGAPGAHGFLMPRLLTFLL